MNKIKFGLPILLTVIGFAGYGLSNPALTKPAALLSPALVGVWQAKVIRDPGVGIAIFSFTPDGMFYTSGDTQHVLYMAHGVWKQIGEDEYYAWSSAVHHDDKNRFIGYQKILIHITQSRDGSKFAGATQVTWQDRNGIALRESELELAAQRIEDDLAW